MAGIIGIKITEDQFREDIGDYFYEQLVERREVPSFMHAVREAMLEDYWDELEYFTAEYGLE